MNGEDVRAVRFARTGGYDVSQVSDLLTQIAAELDAGRPPWPLVENATFETSAKGYDIDAVDWFLGKLMRQTSDHHDGRTALDPWIGLAPVGQSITVGEDPATASRWTTLLDAQPADRGERVAGPSWESVKAAWQSNAQRRRLYSAECGTAWRQFAEVPGTHLRWAAVSLANRELLTMDMRPLATRRANARSMTVGQSGRTLSFKKEERSTHSWSPVRADVAARSSKDLHGHFAAKPPPSAKPPKSGDVARAQRRAEAAVQELVDEHGLPVLYISGVNFNRRACACISFPGQRWLRFLVRGTKPGNSIMTAVDQGGQSVARYRLNGHRTRGRKIVEVAVHPECALTDEMTAAIAIAAPWLRSYYAAPREGGG